MTYQERKESAINKAIEWQANFADNYYSYGELYEYQCYFEKLAKYYGLTKKFKGNGII